MADLLCPVCNAANRSSSRYCRRCGSDLFHDVTVVPAQPTSLQRISRALPSKQAKQVGQAVAVSVAALALEAGVSWLRRRMRQQRDVTLPAVQEPKPATAQPRPQSVSIARRSGGVTMMRQRTVQVWQNGEMTQEIVDSEQIVFRPDDL